MRWTETKGQISQNEQNRTQLQNELEQLKQQCRQFERQISDKDEAKKNVDLLIDQYRQQLTNEKELRTSKIIKFSLKLKYIDINIVRCRGFTDYEIKKLTKIY